MSKAQATGSGPYWLSVDCLVRHLQAYPQASGMFSGDEGIPSRGDLSGLWPRTP